MRIPRFRRTLGRTMGLALLVALMACAILARRPQSLPAPAAPRGGVVNEQGPPTPSLAESQADAAYKQAMLAREVAEQALKEYVEGISGPERPRIERGKSPLDRSIDRAYGSNMPIIGNHGLMAPERPDAPVNVAKDKTIRELVGEVRKAHAEEHARLAACRAERAKRVNRPLIP